ncbi:MAG: bifunctional 2-polyprenyl-6-hydroxyphenol methylase/3-demethylubiquinol 3-O-methyltransferase UbiG [Alphaproteobacteria bacterium]|nr:bifunctional 2-polyprenyl-6-hydroxyphenol methylase/3-demethylubiquinol 3-O-methyltransferase UbiG [Alphaproteobacteria bacterium]
MHTSGTEADAANGNVDGRGNRVAEGNRVAGGNVDPREVDRFAALASKWWDTNGEFRPLHQIGPARLSFIRDAVTGHFRIDSRTVRAFSGLKILDVGCGGGLISEPMARLGGSVTGIDPAAENIAAASAHAGDQGLAIDYRAVRVEDLAEAGEQFDVVVCLEVVEHVPDPAAFLATCAKTVRPGGLFITSTINRTVKAYGLAIFAAEHVLRWLPRGTHQWERFVTPDELTEALTECGLENIRFSGLGFDLLQDRWQLVSDTDVNYIASAEKPDSR